MCFSKFFKIKKIFAETDEIKHDLYPRFSWCFPVSIAPGSQGTAAGGHFCP